MKSTKACSASEIGVARKLVEAVLTLTLMFNKASVATVPARAMETRVYLADGIRIF
jgi:hypothetical protein